MRTSFLYLSLLVQLLCALPVLCERYHAHSDGPEGCIVSTGEEKVGDQINTVHFSGHCPPFAVVDVEPPIGDKTTEGVVKGKNGKLYIGMSKGKKLIWDDKPFKWEFHPATFKPYHVITLPGKSGFWFNNENKDVEVIEPPVKEGDAWWVFDKA